jgi:class 3 adenylate cyclase
MTEPPIQYCTTKDGVNIAYYTSGRGPPFIWMTLPSNLKAEQKLLPGERGPYVRYDHRGFGLSERDVAAFPLEALVSDLEAVVDKLGLIKFVLFSGGGYSAPIAMSYAAAHPERVSRLILNTAFARIPPQFHQQVQSLLTSTNDWRYVTESMVRLLTGWEDEEQSRVIAAGIRDASTFETFKAFWRDAGQWDVRDLLPSIVTPTLVLNPADSPIAGPEQSREIASLMPDARAAIAEGLTFAERGPQYNSAIASFLSSDGPERERNSSRPPRTAGGTAIILFADIANSTGLTEQLGDTEFRDRSRALDKALRNLIRKTGGKPVEGKLLGDGLMAVFTSARDAIECALRCSDASAATDLRLHLGVHAGDVIHEADNVYGGAVNIASRVAGASAPGEVLVSDIVRGLARTSTDVAFLDRGERELKGVSDPVRLYEVRWREGE